MIELELHGVNVKNLHDNVQRYTTMRIKLRIFSVPTLKNFRHKRTW
jgi:hypothetical protein